MSNPAFRRPLGDRLVARLREPRRFLQVLAGPRQSGKTTLVRQVLDEVGSPSRYATADDPGLRGPAWLASQWEAARLLARESDDGAVLVLDEIQKAAGWSESVKRLWDEDTVAGLPLRVVVLGSAPLLVQRGLTESLAGRFELLRSPHWSLAEMGAAFGWDAGRYVLLGGYPGAASLAGDHERWRSYVLDALVETAVSRDVLLLTRVDKPALLRQVFALGCEHSGQVLSYHKMVGQLQDAGNTTTLAHYLQLLDGAGLVAGLSKFSGSVARRRGSSPKLLALNTGLVTAMSGLGPDTAQERPDVWGRLVETAVGAHLRNGLAGTGVEVEWWREGAHEVDLVLRGPRGVAAVEVKSGRPGRPLPGLDAFRRAHRVDRLLLVGSGGVPLEDFLEAPAATWAA